MRTIILILFVLCLIPSILASPISPDIAHFNLNLTKGVSKVIELNINNPNTYALYDVIAEGDVVVTSTTVNTLEGGENISFSITIMSDVKGVFDKTVKIVGFTRLNCSAIETQTYDIDITSGGAHPRNMEICKDDNIKYTNNYGSSIYLDIDDLDVYQGIENGNSHVQGFPTTGTTIYRIEPLIDLGYIEVADEFSNVHDNDDDGIITLHIDNKLEETSISVEYAKINFSMSYMEIKSSYFIITNTGDKVAENVNLIGDWISFDKNNFNINPGEEKAINFVISPEISQSSDTDKSYNKTIYIAGDNIDTTTKHISIFIKYSDVAAGNISSPEWWIKRKAFCDAYPSSPDCLTEPYIIYRDKKIYDAPDILMNMSAADVKKYLDEINGLRNEWTSYNNQWKLDSEIMKNGIANSQSLANQSLLAEKTNTKDFKSFKNVFYIIFGTLTMVLFTCGAGFVAYKYYLRNKSLKEGYW